MAQGNPAVFRAALSAISAKHPDWTTERTMAAIEKLDSAGLLSLTGDGGLFVDVSSDSKLNDVLRAAPNLVELPSGDTDTDKVRRTMIKDAKAGQAPSAVLNRETLKEKLAKLPALGEHASDAAKCARAREVERAYAESGHTETVPNGG